MKKINLILLWISLSVDQFRWMRNGNGLGGVWGAEFEMECPKDKFDCRMSIPKQTGVK